MNIYQKLRSSYEKTYKTVNHFILYFDVIYSAKQTITLFERPWITTEINGKFIEVDSPNRPAIYFDAKTSVLQVQMVVTKYRAALTAIINTYSWAK